MKGTKPKTATTLAVLLVALAAVTVEAASEPEAQRQKAESIVIEPRVVPEPPRVPPRPPDFGFDVDIWTDRQVYEVGDLVRIYFRVTRPAYVYIFNTDTRGVTRQLFPNHYDRDSYCVPGRRYFIPDASYKLRVIGPPGTEELRIVAVRYRPTFFERQRRYSLDDPFPVYPEGAKGFLREYQREERGPRSDGSERPRSRGDENYEYRRERSTDEAARGRREVAAKRPEAMGGERTRPESIVVEPVRPDTVVIEGPDVTYDRNYAEAYTTFRVVDTYRRPRPDYYGRFSVDTNPAGARVYVDGRYRGRAPLTIEYLEPGRHEIEVSLPGFVTWRDDIRVREGATTRVDVRLRPQRPRIFFDFRF